MQTISFQIVIETTIASIHQWRQLLISPSLRANRAAEAGRFAQKIATMIQGTVSAQGNAVLNRDMSYGLLVAVGAGCV